MIPGGFLDLSGERFAAVYRLCGSEDEARAQARNVCVEQTIEFPADLVGPGDIRDHIVGRVESFKELKPRCWEVTISYAVEVVGAELTQLVNVVFGNVSLMPGIRLERLELSPGLLERFRGPRFGRQGLRDLFSAPKRPLLATASWPTSPLPWPSSSSAPPSPRRWEPEGCSWRPAWWASTPSAAWPTTTRWRCRS